MKKMLFFVNPVAGKEEMKTRLMEIISKFTKAGYDVTCHPTQKAGDIPEFIASHGENYDMIVSCGGDGTLNETATGIMKIEKRPVIGFIPAGTVNDLAYSLKLSTKITESSDNVVNGVAKDIDLGYFNDEYYFTYVAAFGAFTKVSYATGHASKQKLGRLAYLIAGVKAFFEIKPIHVICDFDDVHIDDTVVLGMVSNSVSIGGFHLHNEDWVDFSDGKHEVILFKKPNGLGQTIGLLMCLATRKFKPEYSYVYHTDKVSFTFDEPIAWTRDGEYGGDHTKVEIRTIKTPFKIVCPEK